MHTSLEDHKSHINSIVIKSALLAEGAGIKGRLDSGMDSGLDSGLWSSLLRLLSF